MAGWYEELIKKSSISDKVKLIPVSWHTDKSSRHLYQILVDENKIRQRYNTTVLVF